jgi:hypothetical protein
MFSSVNPASTAPEPVAAWAARRNAYSAAAAALRMEKVAPSHTQDDERLCFYRRSRASEAALVNFSPAQDGYNELWRLLQVARSLFWPQVIWAK